MKRNTIIAALGMISWLGLSGASAYADNAWTAFKSGHMRADGAVVDSYSGFTHSEGQSYAMLLAADAGDRRSFDAAWGFAKVRLRRPDGLFSWKFEKDQVADKNNASDAEIVMAWALLKAGKLWGASYIAEAMPIISSIKAKLVVSRPDPEDPKRSLFLLLPGTDGFQNKDGTLKLNPSYWVYPAFDAFAAVDDAAFWNALSASGIRLLELTEGKGYGLTPDWIAFPAMTPAADQSTKSSYDAMRIPLWVTWSGRTVPAIQNWRKLWGEQSAAWKDYSSGTYAPYAPQAEHLSILALLDRMAGQPGAGLRRLPVVGQNTPYFTSALIQLVRAAWKERFAE